MNNETKKAAFAKYMSGDSMDVCLGRFSEESFDAGYDHAAAEMRWIPVSERLPERSGAYDVTLYDGTIGKSAFYVGAFDKSVIAWMPPPTQPYTEPVDQLPDAGSEGEGI